MINRGKSIDKESRDKIIDIFQSIGFNSVNEFLLSNKNDLFVNITKDYFESNSKFYITLGRIPRLIKEEGGLWAPTGYGMPLDSFIQLLDDKDREVILYNLDLFS